MSRAGGGALPGGFCCWSVVLLALAGRAAWRVLRARRATPALAPGVPASAFAQHGFPDYPGATPLGGVQSVSSAGGGLLWDGLTATASPAEVVAHFRALLGDAGFAAGAEGGGTWCLPPGDAPRHVLDILPICSPGPLYELDGPIPPDARTAIIVTTRSGPAGPDA